METQFSVRFLILRGSAENLRSSSGFGGNSSRFITPGFLRGFPNLRGSGGEFTNFGGVKMKFIKFITPGFGDEFHFRPFHPIHSPKMAKFITPKFITIHHKFITPKFTDFQKIRIFQKFTDFPKFTEFLGLVLGSGWGDDFEGAVC